MYISWIEEEKERLAKQLEALEEIEMKVERKVEEIISDLRDVLTERSAETAEEMVDELGIEDSVWGEKAQELDEAIQERVAEEFYV